MIPCSEFVNGHQHHYFGCVSHCKLPSSGVMQIQTSGSLYSMAVAKSRYSDRPGGSSACSDGSVLNVRTVFEFSYEGNFNNRVHDGDDSCVLNMHCLKDLLKHLRDLSDGLLPTLKTEQRHLHVVAAQVVFRQTPSRRPSGIVVYFHEVKPFLPLHAFHTLPPSTLLQHRPNSSSRRRRLY